MSKRIFISIFKSLRPKQWIKNFFVFAAILFSQNLYNIFMVKRVVAIFIIFCFLCSGTYLINDVIDKEKDRVHPKKKRRPIASGDIPIWMAVSLAVLLLTFSLTVSFKFGFYIGLISSIYFIQALLYSVYFKKIVIIDALFIAFGFVLRVAVGGAVINVAVSIWLLICIILLALFLALCKRRHEINLLNQNASQHRSILDHYSIELLDQMISVVTSSTLVVYLLYTFLSARNDNLMFTIPFVLYGIFRYLYLVYVKNEGGEPEDTVIKDKPMIINISLWVLAVYIILYI